MQGLERIIRQERPRVLATLVRLFGDLDLAEDALQEAVTAALSQWPADGIPDNPRAWLLRAARFRAIDALRKSARSDAPMPEDLAADTFKLPDAEIADDRLRLIFICCHPALPSHCQVALTLREVAGLTTDEIASAYLQTSTTIAQRIVRAKQKIRSEGLSYELPHGAELAGRLDSVLCTIYLVFNEGYFASSGYSLLRPNLSYEAIRLGRLLWDLNPMPEVAGLLGLMLLSEARRPARATPDGDLILLEAQDRSLWDRSLIAEGVAFTERALQPPFGTYALQAAISAVHTTSPSVQETDWNEIVHLYDLLLARGENPVVSLNRAVALAMRDGPLAGLALIEVLADGELARYGMAHTARGDLLRQLGRQDEARAAFEKALSLAKQDAERRFLTRKIQELS